MKLKVGSRESKLAVIQAEIVINAIKKNHPDLEFELVTMKTTGDIILNQTLDKIGGKGLFVKELDRALYEKKVDLTVHSLKDMPMETNPDLPIVAVSSREDPRDALVLPIGASELDFHKPIGCSSARRRIQLKRLFPNSVISPVRGNVLTRLEKLDRGEFSALVLASAGLKRLGLENRISRLFEPNEILPAACQGILAVQARSDFDPDILTGFHDPKVWSVAQAERSFVTALDGGCSSPVAAYAQWVGEDLCLTGLYAEEDSEIFKIATQTAPGQEAQKLGSSLALRMKKENQS